VNCVALPPITLRSGLKNMSNLLKNKKDGMIFGVCAGLSDYTGIDVTIIRLLTVFGAIASGSIIFWVYLLLGILLPKKED